MHAPPPVPQSTFETNKDHVFLKTKIVIKVVKYRVLLGLLLSSIQHSKYLGKKLLWGKMWEYFGLGIQFVIKECANII